MSDQSSFKAGSGTGGKSALGKEQESNGKDTYHGGYKDGSKGMSEAEKWGTNLNPVQDGSLPAKGLRNAGG